MSEGHPILKSGKQADEMPSLTLLPVGPGKAGIRSASASWENDMTIENDMAKNLESFATDLNARRASQERSRYGKEELPSARAEWLQTKIAYMHRLHHLEPGMSPGDFAILTGMLAEYKAELEEISK